MVKSQKSSLTLRLWTVTDRKMKELRVIVYTVHLSPWYQQLWYIAGWELGAHSCNFWSVAKEAGQWTSTSISHLQSYQCIDTNIMTIETSNKLLVVNHH